MKPKEGLKPIGSFLNSCRKGIESVLNYKRPAFWIMIAAAFICIGVLGIHAVNPRIYNYADASDETVGSAQQIHGNRTEYAGSDGGEVAEATVPESAIYSPDGNWAVWSNVQENLRDENGLFYSIYQVLLYHTQTGKVTIFDIVGGYFDFLWSENSRFLAVTYSGREWTHFSIVDTITLTETPGPYRASVLEQLKAQGERLDYTANETRPDPVLTPVEWFPDSSKVLVSYQWRDTSYMTQSGTFVYEVESGRISGLSQNSPHQDG
ncbi:hypothetical protein Dhaf_3208 [Desulfitobacterium hafniense DCB-2]|nr:hypothetical protein [Desulfitobacterium hafniense]ACL21228.1 hypothetical protein Dhaf_3208 [Desulfitobacterium hafniense DCB-2]KTE91402.1 hypothetical protein AT727_22465 [Desulfitobacterium hafniense]MEA5024918.1 hypothetical protein [Desulfitobacterium hafniense]CDX02131.1 RelB antitoxin/Antitoxin DinJ [Desulfitobacterium hafniense]